MTTFFQLPTGQSLAPMVKHNNHFPELAQKYPNLDRMARILATGQFEAYQRDTDIDTYKQNIKAISEEGVVFRAEQQLIFQSDIKYLEQADVEIDEFEKEINTKSSKLNTTQVYKKQQEIERSKLNLMKARRLLLRQDLNLRKEIGNIDIAMTTKHSRIFQLLFQIKENMVKGVSYDPKVKIEFMQLSPSLLPLNHAKDQLRAVWKRVRKERAKLEREMEDGRT